MVKHIFIFNGFNRILDLESIMKLTKKMRTQNKLPKQKMRSKTESKYKFHLLFKSIRFYVAKRNFSEGTTAFVS